MTDYHKKYKTKSPEAIARIKELEKETTRLAAMLNSNHAPIGSKVSWCVHSEKCAIVEKTKYESNSALDAANKSLSVAASENAELKIDALYNEKEITRLEGKVTGLAVALEIAMESIK